MAARKVVRVTKGMFRVTKRAVGDIELLADVKRKVTLVTFVHPVNHRPPLIEMQPGDCLFLPGYSVHDRFPGMKYLSLPTRINGKQPVWSVRTTQENGLRGVRVRRDD